MRSFVTGASGFVGQHLAPRLLREGPVTTLQRPDGPHAVPPGCRALEGDITVAADLEDVPAMDVVFHLAAEASPQRAAADPERTRRVNVEGTRNVARMARRAGARMVFLSTGQVYGPSRGHPFRETDPIAPQGPYPSSKAAAEQVVREEAARGLQATSMRCFNMYGPAQVGPYVIPAMLEAIAGGKTPALRDLAPARDFLYIADAVEAMTLAATKPDVPPLLNVASGRTHTIAEVARIACKLADVEPPTGPFVNADKVEADVGRLHSLGWTPKVGLEQGLRETLSWWRAAKR